MRHELILCAFAWVTCGMGLVATLHMIGGRWRRSFKLLTLGLVLLNGLPGVHWLLVLAS